MSEPKRLIDGDGPARLLLESMRDEGLSPEAKANMRAMLGIGAGYTGGSTVLAKGSAGKTALAPSAGGKALGGIGAAKWVGAIAIAGGVAGGAWTLERIEPRSPIDTAASSSKAWAQTPPVPSVAAPHEPDTHDEPATDTVAEPRLATTASPEAPRPVKGATARAPAGGSDVTEELRLLEAARRELRSGDPSAALTSLAQYRQHAPRGALRLEADALEVEATIAAGHREEGVKKGGRFSLDMERARSPNVFGA